MVGKRSAAKKVTSQSAEERTPRATSRSPAKEPKSKKARLDASSDLVSHLTTSAGVFDIFAASGSRPLPEEAVAKEGSSAKVTYCRFCQIVVNISPKVALVDTLEKALEEGPMKNVSYQLDLQLGTSAPFASIQDILAASGSRTLPEEVLAVDTEVEEAVGRI